MKKLIISVVVALLALTVLAGCGFKLPLGGTAYRKTGNAESVFMDAREGQDSVSGSKGCNVDAAGPKARLMSIIKRDDPVKGS